MMSLKQHLLAHYEVGIHASVCNFKRLRLKHSSSKNRLVFLKRCLAHNITPRFLRNKCPVSTSRANALTTKYQKNLLKECFAKEKRKLHKMIANITKQKEYLQQKLSTQDLQKVVRVTDIAYEREFIKHRSKLKSKFENLQKENTIQISTPSRPSTVNNPVLQLQPESLPPEALSILNKGPKFALTHKKIPYMDIIQETEKAAQSLEHQNLPEKGEKLRQDVSKILHSLNNNPHRHKSNLTTTEQKGLKFLQQKIKSNEIAITAHDKGQGFVTLEPETLKQS